MTDPGTPGDALHAAGKRLTAQREAARKVSAEIADQRAAQTPPPVPDTAERAS